MPLLKSFLESTGILFHHILGFEIWMDVVPYDE
jgi:hypothetical protein